MNLTCHCWLPILAIVSLLNLPASVSADLIVYTDQTSYLNDLNSFGYRRVNEGFENDAVWGDVRSTVVGGNSTAPSVTSRGITWTSNVAASEITPVAERRVQGLGEFTVCPTVTLPTSVTGSPAPPAKHCSLPEDLYEPIRRLQVCRCGWTSDWLPKWKSILMTPEY